MTRLGNAIPKDVVHSHWVEIRETRREDIPSLLQVEEAAWPDFLRFDESHFESHMDVFPAGSICAIVKDRIVGTATVQVVRWQDIACLSEWTWYTATDNGYIRKTHNNKGDTIYGVSLSVHPKYRASYVGIVMMEHYRRMIIQKNLRQAIVEARITGFAEAYTKNKRLVAEMYVRSEESDPDLDFYKRLGMQLVTVVPNYVQDPDSLNYAAIMAWRNPLFVGGE